jgi:DNA-damage-inducible protein D
MRVVRHPLTVPSLLRDERIHRASHEGQTYFAAADIVGVLINSEFAAEVWEDLKQREPLIEQYVTTLDLSDGAGKFKPADFVPLEGVLRIIQAIPSATAERLKRWLAESGRQRLEEADNPELAVLRTRRLYEMRGHNPQWIDKRLHAVSARHELTREWAKRGVSESEHYRTLTNDLMSAAFGMDVQGYRQAKNLAGPNQNLRDHMTDLELVLTLLAETTTANLHRDRDSHGFDQLDRDARDAGAIVAGTRAAIEHTGGRAIITPAA